MKTALGSVLTLLAAATFGHAADLERFRFTEPHMGTRVTITVYAPGEEPARAGVDRAFARIRELNSILSDYDEESELMRLSRQPPGTPVAVGDDLLAVLARAGAISVLTGGAFDITVGPLARLWREARASATLPDPEMIERARRATGYRKLCIDREAGTVTLLAEGMRLDPGGIGKGYAADAALAVLRETGLSQALVAVGGDLAIGDPPPGARGWRVGIAPGGGTGNAGVSPRLLANTAVSTSGDAEQFVEIEGIRYSHILDPRTGLGLTGRMAVTVIAPDAATADALATAISVMGSLEGLALVEFLPGIEALILRITEPCPVKTLSSGFPK